MPETQIDISTIHEQLQALLLGQKELVKEQQELRRQLALKDKTWITRKEAAQILGVREDVVSGFKREQVFQYQMLPGCAVKYKCLRTSVERLGQLIDDGKITYTVKNNKVEIINRP